MPSSSENHKFTSDILAAGSLLDNAIDWIQCNMSVEDVFPEEVLAEWAEENGYVKAEE